MAKAVKKLVICIDNSGYEVSLERRKIYVATPEGRAESLGQIRVVDESGEDYLYPQKILHCGVVTATNSASRPSGGLTFVRADRP